MGVSSTCRQLPPSAAQRVAISVLASHAEQPRNGKAVRLSLKHSKGVSASPGLPAAAQAREHRLERAMGPPAGAAAAKVGFLQERNIGCGLRSASQAPKLQYPMLVIFFIASVVYSRQVRLRPAAPTGPRWRQAGRELPLFCPRASRSLRTWHLPSSHVHEHHWTFKRSFPVPPAGASVLAVSCWPCGARPFIYPFGYGATFAARFAACGD